MKLTEILDELEKYGNETIKKIYMNHGAKEPLFGVKISDLKKILKKIKTNYELALELWDTGNSDAMYLAGLLTDPKQMTIGNLNKWASDAYWYMLAEYSVAGVAAESPNALKLSREWMKSSNEMIASAGWACYSGYISITPNNELDILEIKRLIEKAALNVHQAQNRVRYSMNGFIISAGIYIPEILEIAQNKAREIGKVQVDMGETSCKVPLASEYIKKVVNLNRLGKKRKTVRC